MLILLIVVLVVLILDFAAGIWYARHTRAKLTAQLAELHGVLAELRGLVGKEKRS